jgi:hypothetical protein
MTRHHLRRREAGWRKGIAINGFGAILSLVVAVIIGVTKFADGAWAILVALPVLVVLFHRVHRQYESEHTELEEDVPAAAAAPVLRRHVVLVFVDKLDLATARAVQYARTLTPDDLRAVHFAIDPQAAAELRSAWAAAGMSRVTLDLVACHDRRIARAAVELVARDLADGDTEVSVLLPDRKFTGPWHRILHDRTADAIERAVSQLAHANVTTVPFHLGQGDRGRPAARRKVVAVPRTGGGTPGAGTLGPPEPPVDGNGVAGDGGGTTTAGITAIRRARWRHHAVVEGEVATVRLTPTPGGHLLEVVIDDGTGVLSLVFNGRRAISGMELGAHVRAEGTLATHRGRRAIFNPVYTLLIARR